MLRNLLRLPKAFKLQPKIFYPSAYRNLSNNYVARFSTNQPPAENAQLQEEVETKIFEVLKSAAKCKTDKLARKATFDELGFDSLDTVELVVAMEENLGVDIQDEDAEKIQTVDDAVKVFYKYVNEKINKGTEPTQN